MSTFSNYVSKIPNNVWAGLLVGLLIPGILLVGAWYLIHIINALQKADLLYIGCIAVNAYSMQLFFKMNKEMAGRGILSATFLWAFVFFFYKVA